MPVQLREVALEQVLVQVQEVALEQALGWEPVPRQGHRPLQQFEPILQSHRPRHRSQGANFGGQLNPG